MSRVKSKPHHSTLQDEIKAYIFQLTSYKTFCNASERDNKICIDRCGEVYFVNGFNYRRELKQSCEILNSAH